MVFVGGPRQVGKTTFGLRFLSPKADESHSGYLNWDDAADRARLISGEIPTQEPLILLDEIHKFSRWRQLIKGLYDKLKSKLSILVTGSARLDQYRKGGDSFFIKFTSKKKIMAQLKRIFVYFPFRNFAKN